MAGPTIALYASPPSSVCSTTHQISSHASYDFESSSRSSSSASSTPSSSQKPIVGGLSCLFSSPSVKHASSSPSFLTGGEELSSLWHDNRGDDLGSSHSYSHYSSFNCSSLKRDQSPVSVFQGPVSCSSSVSRSSPPMRISRERNGDIHVSASIRANSSGLFSGFVRNALGSCIDYDSPSFGVHANALVDELTFNMEDSFTERNLEPYANGLLLNAQLRHKVFCEDFVIKAFYEAEKAHRGQVKIE